MSQTQEVAWLHLLDLMTAKSIFSLSLIVVTAHYQLSMTEVILWWSSLNTRTISWTKRWMILWWRKDPVSTSWVTTLPCHRHSNLIKLCIRTKVSRKRYLLETMGSSNTTHQENNRKMIRNSFKINNSIRPLTNSTLKMMNI